MRNIRQERRQEVLGVETLEETQRRWLRKKRAAIMAIQNSMEHRVLAAEQDLNGGLSKRQWELSVQIWRQEIHD